MQEVGDNVSCEEYLEYLVKKYSPAAPDMQEESGALGAGKRSARAMLDPNVRFPLTLD